VNQGFNGYAVWVEYDSPRDGDDTLTDSDAAGKWLATFATREDAEVYRARKEKEYQR